MGESKGTWPVDPLSDNHDISSTAVQLESDLNSVVLVPSDKPLILHRCFFTDEAVCGGVMSFWRVQLMYGGYTNSITIPKRRMATHKVHS